MCGICGIFDLGGAPVAPSEIDAMLGVIGHRGPDHRGVHVSGNAGVGIRRLSIIDLSERGNQPIQNENGYMRVVCNGEIYNFRQLRAELEGKGHKFRSGSDAEVIVHGYEEWGEGCPGRLRGMFAFAVLDSSRGEMFLARDRIGVKPLFYTVAGRRLVFASEIKSIAALPGFDKAIDPEALREYFRFQYIPGERTIWKNVRKLLPGRSMKATLSGIRQEEYWRLELKPEKRRSYSEWEQAVLEQASESIHAEIESDVPLGIFLSGGIDSSLIVALLARSSPGRKIRTFTVGFGTGSGISRGFDERPRARAVAKRFGTEHHELQADDAFPSMIPWMARQFDEPFANLTALPMYCISRAARKHIKVALAGVGGDELFGGYPRYAAAGFLRRYLGLPGCVRKQMLGGLGRLIPDSFPAYSPFNRAKRFLSAGDDSAMGTYLNWVSVFRDDEMDSLLIPGSAATLARPAARVSGYQANMNEVYSWDIANYLPENLLAYSDRMSMAASLEVRVPLCDYKLVELAASIPPGIKIRGGRLKALLKDVACDILPSELTSGKKRGFSVPPYSGLLGEFISGHRGLFSRGYLEGQGILRHSRVTAIINALERGNQGVFQQAATICLFQAWYEIHVRDGLKGEVSALGGG